MQKKEFDTSVESLILQRNENEIHQKELQRELLRIDCYNPKALFLNHMTYLKNKPVYEIIYTYYDRQVWLKCRNQLQKINEKANRARNDLYSGKISFDTHWKIIKDCALMGAPLRDELSEIEKIHGNHARWYDELQSRANRKLGK